MKYRVISINAETKKRFSATFDTKEQAKRSIERNELNPFLTYIIEGNKETLDKLEKEGFTELSNKLYK